MNKEKTARLIQITIIGDSEPDEECINVAKEVGKLIAKKGWVLLCGGKAGVMEAACKAAVENNGITVGILPEVNTSQANNYCSIVIPTGLSYARNSVVALSGDIIVMIGGKAGTLNECSFAWFSNKPIIAVNVGHGWSAKLAGKAIDDRRKDVILSANTAEEVIEHIVRILATKNI